MSCVLTYKLGDIIYLPNSGTTYVCMEVYDHVGYFSRYHFGLIDGGPFGSARVNEGGGFFVVEHSDKAKERPIIGNVCIDCGETPYWNLGMISIVYPELYLRILERELAQRNITWGLPGEFKNEPGADFITLT